MVPNVNPARTGSPCRLAGGIHRARFPILARPDHCPGGSVSRPLTGGPPRAPAFLRFNGRETVFFFFVHRGRKGFRRPRRRAMMRAMTSYKLVMPGDLNHYGFLFGGKMLMWVDEVAWMAVGNDYPGCHFVTVAMSEVTFHKSVHPQSVLRFEAVRRRVGRTSVAYRVEVFARHVDSPMETSVFTTDITFVRVDKDGNKMPIGPAAD